MKCSKCPKDVPGPDTKMCPECHAKEMARIHAHDTPDVPMPKLSKYQPPTGRIRRPHSGGKRVIKKGNGLS